MQWINLCFLSSCTRGHPSDVSDTGANDMEAIILWMCLISLDNGNSSTPPTDQWGQLLWCPRIRAYLEGCPPSMEDTESTPTPKLSQTRGSQPSWSHCPSHFSGSTTRPHLTTWSHTQHQSRYSVNPQGKSGSGSHTATTTYEHIARHHNFAPSCRHKTSNSSSHRSHQHHHPTQQTRIYCIPYNRIYFPQCGS